MLMGFMQGTPKRITQHIHDASIAPSEVSTERWAAARDPTCAEYVPLHRWVRRRRRITRWTAGLPAETRPPHRVHPPLLHSSEVARPSESEVVSQQITYVAF